MSLEGATVRVHVKLYATLRRYVKGAKTGVPIDVDLTEGSTLSDLYVALKLPAQEVKIAYINARARPEDWRLETGDEVGIFPPIGGG